MGKPKDKVVLTFPILWNGWEMDNKGFVMERPDGSHYLQMTSHGGEYKADVEELHSKVAEYEEVLAETRKAIELLTESKS